MQLTIDKEFAALISKPSADEYSQLEQNILEEGCRDDLVVWLPDGEDIPIILDGHNRYKICQEHNVEFTVTYSQVATRHEAKVWAINNQLGRRNLGREQMAYLRGLRYEQEKEQGQRTDLTCGHSDHMLVNDQPKTADTLADEYSVSPKTIRRDAQFTKAVDHITTISDLITKDKILQGKSGMTQKDIRTLAALEDEQAKKILQRISQDEAPNVKTAMAQIEAESIADEPTPDETFNVIVASMPLDKLKSNLAADDSTLWLWTSNAQLTVALEVMRAQGFKYKMTLCLHDKAEHCLMGIKGNPTLTSANQTTTISNKQDEFYQLVESLCPGAKIDLHATIERDDWTTPNAKPATNEGF